MHNCRVTLKVGGFVVHDNHFLFLKRPSNARFFPNIWEIPSGTVYHNEDLCAALRREVFEETSLTIDSIYPLGSFLYRSDFLCIQVNYLCAVTGNTSVNLSTEHSDYAWVETTQALGLNTSQQIRQLTAQASDYISLLTREEL